ncbi:MAG: hypothetical protein DCC59_08505, partial [Chloroflexi bacterium]
RGRDGLHRIKLYIRTGLFILHEQNYNGADLRLIIEVKDLAQLSRILTRIENLPNVMEAARTKPG